MVQLHEIVKCFCTFHKALQDRAADFSTTSQQLTLLQSNVGALLGDELIAELMKKVEALLKSVDTEDL